MEFYEEISGWEKGLGNKFIGFISLNGMEEEELFVYLFWFGGMEVLE